MIFNPVINCNINSELNELLGRCIDSLSITGDWDNTQYTDSDVDYTGLSFTVTYNDGTTSVVTPTSIIPEVWGSTEGEYNCIFSYEENGFKVNAIKEVEVIDKLRSIPLTLQARDTGNISITKTGNPGTIYYSLNDESQIELTSDTNIPVDIGDKVSFYRTLSDDLSSTNYFTINCTNNCHVYGNVMSLIDKDDFAELYVISHTHAFSHLFYQNRYIDINESIYKLFLPATALADYCYNSMFDGCTSLTTAPELPATTLADRCYYYMFQGCTSLTTAPSRLPATTLAENCYDSMFLNCNSLTTPPELPATTLAEYCYSMMFKGCLSLTTVPELPATTLAEYCYYCMFRQCISLTTAPSRLPATTLAENCYESMFSGCTSLATAPELPATTLAKNCYYYMFDGCTSLTTAPELPATTLAFGCYYYMFRRCTNLNEITCLATDISATNCTNSWVNRVSSTGTFYKDSSMTSWTTGTSGIPSGWTVVDK